MREVDHRQKMTKLEVELEKAKAEQAPEAQGRCLACPIEEPRPVT